MTIANPTERAAFIQGLRDLADFLQEHPEVPVTPYGNAITFFPHAASEADERAEIDRIAAALDVKPTGTSDGDFYRAIRKFGPITYKAISISAAWKAAHDARHSYAAVVQP